MRKFIKGIWISVIRQAMENGQDEPGIEGVLNDLHLDDGLLLTTRTGKYLGYLEKRMPSHLVLTPDRLITRPVLPNPFNSTRIPYEEIRELEVVDPSAWRRYADETKTN